MKTMQLAVVFDRKKVSDNKTKKGLVQIRVTYDRKQWFFSTGIKVLKYQWNAPSQRVQRVDVKGAITQQYNDKIELMLEKVQQYDNDRLKNEWAFDIDALKRRIEGGVSDNFISWVRTRIEEKVGILKPETLRSHKSNLNIIAESGKFQKFSDITLENLMRFEEWMTKRGYAPQTKWSKHKVMKIYVGEALRMGKIRANPYENFRCSRGAALKKRIISSAEMDKIRKAKLPPGYDKTRDILLLQYNTGLAYADLYAADFNSLIDVEGIEMLVGLRQKTGIPYYIPITAEVKKILKKHEGVPPMTNQQLNVRLKKVCELAGLDDHQSITSHAFRKGAGSNLLRQGVRMETVSKFLGHSNMKLTEQVYAKLDIESIAKEIKSAIGITKKAARK